MQALELLFSDSNGVYIPRMFAEQCDHWDNIPDDVFPALLTGPDHADYWEAWDEVLQNATYTDPKTGDVYRLHQDGDLWAVCYERLTDAEYSEFFGECRHCGSYGCSGECRVDYWVCDDCLQVAVNGDASCLDYHYSEEEAAKVLALIEAGLAELGNIAPTDHEDEFSRVDCDCCGSSLAGRRYGFVRI